MNNNKYFFLVFLMVSVLTASNLKVFKNAEIYTAAGEHFENGVLVIENGLINYVGDQRMFKLPADAEVYDLEGKAIMPGLVDTHSHIGLDWGFDSDSPTHPDIRILDAIDPNHETFGRARAGGITTLNIMPGSGHLMSGQTVYLKSKKAKTVNEMVFCEDLLNGICGGMKMANGTNSIRNSPFPGTRGKSAAIVRSLFYKALDYKNKIEAAKDDPEKMPPRNIELEPIVEILNKERTIHFHTHRADDIMTVLRLKEEFDFKVVLQHVSEGWKVADEIAKAGVPASVIMIDSPGGKLEAINLSFDTPVILDKAGVDFGLHTDDWITDSRMFLRSGALAIRAGLPKDKAIEALTIAGARMLDLDHRVGSLEKGKDADFIILSGDPFSVYTKIEQTWIDGEKVFDRTFDEDYKYAQGGYMVYPREGHIHIDEELER